MKYFVLVVLINLYAVISFSQSSSAGCSEFKTGEFAYRDSSTNTIWIIKRTTKHQTEKNEKDGIVIKNKIKWLSPCEYQLTQTWTNSKSLKKRNSSSLNYVIVSMAGDSYSYTCNCSDGTKRGGTLVKMPG